MEKPHPNPTSNRPNNLSKDPVNRLAVYGTLAPGKPNHHQLASLQGVWSKGTVHGKLFASGWGAAMGYPGLVLDPAAGPVAVDLFESSALAEAWHRLDTFEGEGYRRVLTPVYVATGRSLAYIYVLTTEAAPTV